jgi:pimeloyl-ACP methyl ester carboxylesterase
MREKAVRFGKTATLVGVVTDPDPGTKVDGLPGLICLNSGLLHRIGACRFHVKLARALAPAGFTSLRFDFSGVGDSDPRRDGLSFDQSAVLEVQEAMEFLTSTRGTKTFVLVGLCSGADMAFEAACADTRVEAMAQLDAYAYRTWRYYLYRYGPKLLSGTSWRNLLTGKTSLVPLLRGLQGQPATPADEEVVASPYARDFPPREKVAAGLQRLVARGVRLFNFFSSEYYVYHRQYVDCFPTVDFRDRLRLEFVPDADHTVTNLEHQKFLLAALADWVRSLRPETRGVAADSRPASAPMAVGAPPAPRPLGA